MKEEKKFTFSKYIMLVVVFLYFVGAIIGTILIVLAASTDIKNRGFVDTQMFIAYAAYLGTPTATAIGFYAWKSKAENLLKIQQTCLKDKNLFIGDGPREMVYGSDTIVNTLANMGGNT